MAPSGQCATLAVLPGQQAHSAIKDFTLLCVIKRLYWSLLSPKPAHSTRNSTLSEKKVRGQGEYQIRFSYARQKFHSLMSSAKRAKSWERKNNYMWRMRKTKAGSKRASKEFFFADIHFIRKIPHKIIASTMRRVLMWATMQSVLCLWESVDAAILSSAFLLGKE